MNDPISVLITWTTYGAWMPGESRGWSKRLRGEQQPQPLLAEWCRKQMKGEAVLLQPCDRKTVEEACRKHCKHREWHLLAVSARSNHVHVVVTSDAKPQTVRDQLKANCTRELRRQERPLIVERTWTKGGDCDMLDTDEDIDAAVIYVLETQDRKGRDSETEKPAQAAFAKIESKETASIAISISEPNSSATGDRVINCSSKQERGTHDTCG